jgi:hypothetical protein
MNAHADELKVLETNCALFDLGYDLEEATIMWPGGLPFKLCMFTSGSTT